MRIMLIALFVVLATASASVLGQSARPITDDDVNAIAEQMYCPVCENIPLDDCGTTTCIAWKNEIGAMLANGFSSDQIVSDFVQRYGEKVVGVPQSPTLRLLAWGLPLLAVLLAATAAALTFTGWNKRKNEPAAVPAPAAAEDPYRRLFEQDVR